MCSRARRSKARALTRRPNKRGSLVTRTSGISIAPIVCRLLRMRKGYLDDMLGDEPCLQFVASNDIAHDQIVGSVVAAVRREARHRSCFFEDDFMRVQQ